MWGDSIGPEFVLDQKSQMFFPTQYHKDVIQKLWIHKCKVCNRTFRDMKSLRAHVNGEHNMHICLHCVENKHDFPAEQRVYTQKQYETHLREGDQDGSQGHPNCEFCRKRYYDSTALFVHLSKDHYSCHLCEKADIKFKYYNDYKCLEEHFAKAHILCDDPACLAKKFIVFDNEIDYEVHNRKYHPTFTVKRSSTIKLDFKLARPCQTNPTNASSREERAQKADGNEEESHDHTNHSSGRFEGGMGGRARDGEWQVELQPISADPRDINRNAHITPGSVPASMPHSASSDALAEEFPTLQGTGSNSGPITLTNKWVSMSTAQGAKRGPKKADFPALQSKPKASMSSKLGGGSSGISSNSGVSSMLRDYDALSNTTSGSVSNNSRAVTGSLGDWARIKVDKKSGTKASTTSTNTHSTTSGAYYSSNPPMNANYEDSLAMALAASLTDAYKASSSTSANTSNTSNAFDDFTPVATKPAAYPPPPPQSSEAYPTLSSTATPVSVAKAPTKKKAVSNNNWGEALSAVGMTSTSAKNTVVKKKLTVIKASTSAESNLNKLAAPAAGGNGGVSGGDVSGVKWESMKPLTKTDDLEYRIGNSKPTTASIVASNSAQDKKYGGWVKMGGATNGSVPSQVDSGANNSDYPSLGSAKRK